MQNQITVKVSSTLAKEHTVYQRAASPVKYTDALLTHKAVPVQCNDLTLWRFDFEITQCPANTYETTARE